MGRLPLFYYFIVQSLSFLISQFFRLLSLPSKILIQVFIALKYIASFVYCIGSLQKILTALFKLAWNTCSSSLSQPLFIVAPQLSRKQTPEPTLNKKSQDCSVVLYSVKKQAPRHISNSQFYCESIYLCALVWPNICT